MRWLAILAVAFVSLFVFALCRAADRADRWAGLK